jgi:N-acylneuraminate cytidylyltransferase/CMP-N,N'-diacetyllegionaminic acid synthase
MVGGKPLISHTIEFALESALFDAIVVTSDDDRVMEIARRYSGVSVVGRPTEMATDLASKIPAIKHAVSWLDSAGIMADTVVDLDPTSPLRIQEDLVGVLKLLAEPDCSNVITGCVARRNPYFNMVEIDDSGSVSLCKPPLVPILSRQTAPVCYDMNASIYAWKRSALFSSDVLFNSGTRMFQMPVERSLDIDSELDFRFVANLLSEGHTSS